MILLSVELSYYFDFSRWIVQLHVTAIQFRRGTRNHLHEALLNSGLTSADSGLQLDLGNRAKRRLSEDPAPAAYSAVLMIVETVG